MATRRPPIASASRLLPRVGPPTGSTTTSKPPSSVSMIFADDYVVVAEGSGDTPPWRPNRPSRRRARPPASARPDPAGCRRLLRRRERARFRRPGFAPPRRGPAARCCCSTPTLAATTSCSAVTSSGSGAASLASVTTTSRVAPAAHDRERRDGLPDAEHVHLRPQRPNPTGDLDSRDVWQRDVDNPAAIEHLGKVHSRVGDVDGDLAGPRLGHAHVARPKNLGAAEARDCDRPDDGFQGLLAGQLLRATREPGGVVLEEEPGDELAARPGPGLLEDRLQMVLDRPRRQVQLLGDRVSCRVPGR